MQWTEKDQSSASSIILFMSLYFWMKYFSPINNHQQIGSFYMRTRVTKNVNRILHAFLENPWTILYIFSPLGSSAHYTVMFFLQRVYIEKDSLHFHDWTFFSTRMSMTKKRNIYIVYLYTFSILNGRRKFSDQFFEK